VWLQYVSHKIGRLVVPYAMLAAFFASLALSESMFYRAVLAAQVVFYMLAGYGAVLELTSREGAPLRREPASRDDAARRAAQEVA
jgi:hypothetical protein